VDLPRTIVTEASTSSHLTTTAAGFVPGNPNIPIPTWNPPPVQAIAYAFPSMEPLRFVEYPQNHLLVPLRRDILHRAVIYEGDKTRQGTASTKWRDDVHGSGRKLYAQKGTGHARVGDKKSPIRVGGGVAFGPHPRDFSTDLPRKIYDKAWRIALSYRFRRGQLIIIDGSISPPKGATPFLIKNIFESNSWGKGFGRSTLITRRKYDKLSELTGKSTEHVKLLDITTVDVKDLLETGRLIMEKSALDKILRDHSTDLKSRPAKARY
jgi:large subunit ribosomal protein L4